MTKILYVAPSLTTCTLYFEHRLNIFLDAYIRNRIFIRYMLSVSWGGYSVFVFNIIYTLAVYVFLCIFYDTFKFLYAK